MADQSPATKPEPQILETDVPLSRSIIWRLQRDYYAQRGLEAWSQDLVPSYITNNPFIAEIYAGIVAAFIEDCLRQSAGAFSAVVPLRILELGAGTGKFAYLFLHKLTPLLREKNIPAQAVRYTMTDCSDPLLARWRANPYLGEFVQSGVLNFELLSAGEAGNSSSLSENSSTSKPAAPLVVIANYVFDSLPQDAFVISHGEICEALVTAGSPAGAVQSPGGLQLSFKNVSLTAPRYSEPSWNAILEHYRSSLPAATIFFPSAALTLLQQLSRSSDGRMLVLAADKGFAHEEELSLIKGEPPLEFHAVDRCFSAQVNLDAMARYFASTGGEVLLPPKHSTNLNICGFLMRRSKDEFPAIRRAYNQALTAFGPDDLFTLMSWLHSYLESVSVPQALAVLRLTRWDPTALLRLFPVIAKQLRNASAERNDLQQAVLSTWANHYPVTAADNALAFSCGVILLELRFYADAMAMFKISEQQLGPSASTSYNLGLCAIGLERPTEALTYMTRACELDPVFEPARSARSRLEAQS